MTNYENYKNKLIRLKDVESAAAVLQWDQEIYMPKDSASIRSGQMATLAGIAHELSVEKSLGTLLSKLNSDKSLNEEQKRNVHESLKDYNKRKKYSTVFVEEHSRAVSAAFNAWQTAKNENKFSLFVQPLEKIIELKKRECDMLGYEEHPYDALIDQYESGAKTKEITTLFTEVRTQLVAFVKQITEKQQNDDSIMYLSYDKQKQWNLSIYLLEQMGYDFKKGRQDVSSHPFTTSFGPTDVRVTTRTDERDLAEIIWSSIHEGGHALYEQGLLESNYGLPAGEAASLAIHESQSRLWENNVGRSSGYWEYNFKKLQTLFPEKTANYTAQDFYKAMNIVKPSFIRTSADELTYHFHVMIRFEIEKSLIEEKIKVKELPDAWNAKYKEYLGIDVPSDAKGVLQDIHWSHGSFGYFPTYSLGSFYAAQFYYAAKKQVPNLENQIKTGNMRPLLNWLRENIHPHGRLLNADETCRKVTGESLNFNYFMDYAKEKYAGIYNLT